MTLAQDEFNELFRDKNKISRHHEDRDNSESESEPEREIFYEKDDQGDDEDDYEPETHDMPSKYYLPSVKHDANTGPKGVIADAQAFEQAKRTQRRPSVRKTEQPMGYSATVYSKDEKSPPEESEESFMQRWRQNRLKELQKSGKRLRQRTVSPSRRIYGSLVTVDGDGFLDAVEKVALDTVVVVFIYDDMSDISIMVEDCVRQLAKKHNTTRFIKLHYEEAEMEPAGVPALLAYRGGDKFAGLVPVMDEIPDDAELSPVSLEAALKKYQVLF